jgi:hypothetical protein
VPFGLVNDGHHRCIHDSTGRESGLDEVTDLEFVHCYGNIARHGRKTP